MSTHKYDRQGLEREFANMDIILSQPSPLHRVQSTAESLLFICRGLVQELERKDQDMKAVVGMVDALGKTIGDQKQKDWKSAKDFNDVLGILKEYTINLVHAYNGKKFIEMEQFDDFMQTECTSDFDRDNVAHPHKEYWCCEKCLEKKYNSIKSL